MKSIRYYFTLQFRFLNRQLTDFGLHPYVGYLLLSLIFASLSWYLFYIAEYAAYIYAFIALSLTSIPGEVNRNRFLKMYFSKPDFQRIRFLENIIWMVPFFIFLCSKNEWIAGMALLAGGALLSFAHFDFTVNRSVPTPFYKYPFEYTVGFRSAFILFFFAYFLTVMAVIHENPNLAIFSIAFILLSCIPFFTNPESSYYVWIYAMRPARFLQHKIGISILYSTFLCLPVIGGMLFFFSDHLKYVLIVYVIGQLYIIAMLLGKYAFFPEKANLPQMILLGISLVFPPLLLFIIPYFYIKSQNQLKAILK